MSHVQKGDHGHQKRRSRSPKKAIRDFSGDGGGLLWELIVSKISIKLFSNFLKNTLRANRPEILPHFENSFQHVDWIHDGKTSIITI